MVQVTVFDDLESAAPKVGSYIRENEGVDSLISQRMIQREQEYRERTNYNERVAQAAKRASPIQPELVALPAKISDQLAQGAGEGLELTYIVELSKQNGTYQLSVGTGSPTPDLINYKSPADLAKSVCEYLDQAASLAAGATLVPFFYTIAAPLFDGAAVKKDREEIRDTDEENKPTHIFGIPVSKAECLDFLVGVAEGEQVFDEKDREAFLKEFHRIYDVG